MTKHYLPLLFLSTCLLAAEILSPATIQERVTTENLKEIVLANELISCSILPEASGLFSRFEYLPNHRSLFVPIKLSVERDDLMPTRINANATGVRELLWGMRRFHNLPMTIIARQGNGETVSITMRQRFFCGSPLTAEKTLELPGGDSSLLRCHFTLQNPSSKPVQASLWCNLIAKLGLKLLDPVVMPVKGGIYRVQNRGITGFRKDAVYLENDPSSIDVFTAPGRPWIARFSHENPGVLVMRCTTDGALGPESRFYSYKRGERTMELICAPVSIAPGSSHTWDFEYIYFPTLNMVRDVAGSYAVNRRDQPNATILELEPCIPVPAGQLTLANGQIFQIPAMRPGQLHTIAISQTPLDTVLSGTLPDHAVFCINPLVTETDIGLE